MRFLVHRSDFALEQAAADGPFQLSASTSVNTLKQQFFGLLGELGELKQVDDTSPPEELKQFCAAPDTLYAAVHGEPPEHTPCRLLRHSLGGLMVPGGFLNGWEFRPGTTNMVTSQRQMQQLQQGLGRACPELGVLTPGMDTSLFHLPEQCQRSARGGFKLLYSGRFIANKGLTQTVRALNLWPISGASLTLVGSYEPDFFLYHSNATHATFPSFFAREVLERSPHLPVHVEAARPRAALAQVYQEADCFVYASFHEDENFGLAPREAILCGLPAVVTDLCGLGQLDATSGGALATYPSLAGVRFSLRALRDRIAGIAERSPAERRASAQADAALVRAECDQNSARASLRHAVEQLLKQPVSPAPTGGWRSKDRWDRLVELGPPSFAHAERQRSAPIPDGLYVDGTGFPPDGRWFSDAHFMQAIQGLYTTFPTPPRAEKNMVYRGFWRIALWQEERALVEFGFPGPRICRFQADEWRSLVSCVKLNGSVEPFLHPSTVDQLKPVQRLIDLGFVVPDNL